MAALPPEDATQSLTSWTPLRRAGLAAGGALLFALLVHAGPEALARSLAEVGWRFVVVLPLGGATALLNALSWWLATPPARRVPLGALLRMLLAGEAVNTLAPVGLVGGEVVRYRGLSRWIPSPDAFKSVALAATTQFAAQVIFIVLALPAVLLALVESRWRVPVLAATAGGVVLLSAMICVVVAPSGVRALARRVMRPPGAARLLSLVPRSATDFLRGMAAELRRRPRDLCLSTAAALVAWQVGVVETRLVLGLMGHAVSYGRALAIESLAVAIEGVLFFVPARLGTLEGGRVAACMAVGLDPAAGLTLGIVRRTRELVWAACGLAFLATTRSGREREAKASQPLAPGVIRGGPPLPG